jgi:hypothetical protein
MSGGALRSVRQATGVVLLFVVGACGSSTAPHTTTPTPHPNIYFLAGNQQTDTVQSVPAQALVVLITHNGSLVPGAVVQFEAVSAADSVNPYGGDWVDIAPLSSNQPTSFVAETTNTQGEANVDVYFGTRAGTAPLVVKVPALGYVDTAKFTVTAGSAATLQSGPVDTSVYVNGTVKLHSAVVDRFGNPRTDPVSYALLSGPAHLSGSTVTVTGIGRVAVTGMANKAIDTSYISGIPSGTMAASLDAGGIATFNLDGSGYRVITTTAAGTVVWNPSGTSLVFDQTSGGGTSGGDATLFSTTTSGSVTVLDNSGGPTDAWPSYSHDGTWIYYTKITNNFDIWRVHPDGTSDSLLSAQAGAFSSEFPSPSPDGTQLVYLVPGSAAVEILNLSTGVVTPLGSIVANSTAWSPNQNVIAYNANGIISIIHPDGTGQTTLTGATYEYQLGWSPDGNWIVARNIYTRKIDLISVTTPGLILPLGYTGTMDSPTWH